jgi:hypothetical protein
MVPVPMISMYLFLYCALKLGGWHAQPFILKKLLCMNHAKVSEENHYEGS